VRKKAAKLPTAARRKVGLAGITDAGLSLDIFQLVGFGLFFFF
jgi:hypothetical protein